MPTPATEGFLFVVGCFRSGTSLLYACLNQHPEIALMYETEMLSIELPDRLRLHSRWLENANAWGKFLGRHGFPSQPSKAGEFLDSPDQIYSAYASLKGARYGGEKSPAYMVCIPKVLELFPGCKIITISRNPSAIYKSIRQAAEKDPFFARGHMLERALAGQEQMIKDCLALKAQGHNFWHTTYEELTADPESVCRSACEYLNLEFEPRMLDLSGADLSAVYKAEHHIKLRSEKISATATDNTGLDPELISSLDKLWGRWKGVITTLRSHCKDSVLPPVPDPVCAHLIAVGMRLRSREKWKRRIYHLIPAEFIRMFRAAKVLVEKARQAEREYFPPKQMFRMQLWAGVLMVTSLCLGIGILAASKSTWSPLPFFFALPLIAGWSFGWRGIPVASLAAALAWTVSAPLFSGIEPNAMGIIWNILSRTTILAILGVFAWHLKATLLAHQKDPN